LGDLLAEREAGVAHKANNISAASQKPDDLVFAKADFTEALAQLGRCTKLADTNGHTCFHAIEGAKRVLTT